MEQINKKTPFFFQTYTQSRWRVQRGRALLSVQFNYFHFHAVFGKIGPNNRLTPPPLELVPPPEITTDVS